MEEFARRQAVGTFVEFKPGIVQEVVKSEKTWRSSTPSSDLVLGVRLRDDETVLAQLGELTEDHNR